jgi:hypothetical protein
MFYEMAANPSPLDGVSIALGAAIPGGIPLGVSWNGTPLAIPVPTLAEGLQAALGLPTMADATRPIMDASNDEMQAANNGPQKAPCPTVNAPPGQNLHANNAAIRNSAAYITNLAIAYATMLKTSYQNVCCWQSAWNYNRQGSAYDNAGNQ